jgi:thiol-disulfide isomerase/thioredoxin
MPDEAPTARLRTGLKKNAWYNRAVSLEFHSGHSPIVGSSPAGRHDSVAADQAGSITALKSDSCAFSRVPAAESHPYKKAAGGPRSSLIFTKQTTSRLGNLPGLLFYFAVVLVLASSAFAQEAAPSQPDSAPVQPNSGPVIRFVRNPDLAPDFKVDDLDGKPLSLSAARGKVVLLNFWATWCGPCRAEVPDLIELQKKYGDRLQIIGLDVDDDDVAEVKKFVEKNGINYPVGMATNEIRIQYGGVATLPTSFVLDTDGRVVQKHEGLRNPLLYEFEIRSLIGLQIPARVETFEDTGEIFLKHADRALTLPGVDMSKLTPEQKQVALHRFNAEGCTCGCQFTLAQCRIYDRGCPISKARTAKIMAEITAHPGASPEHKAQSPKDTPAAPAADAPNPNPTQHANLP